MPSQVALISCIIFVFWLLRLDHKQTPKASLTLWIPTIWMLINSSKPLGVWLKSGGTLSVEEGSPWDRAILISLLCVGLIVLARKGFQWSAAIRTNSSLVLILGYMLISILWSDIPFVSFKRWTRELVAIVMVFVIASEREPHQAIQSVFRRVIYVLIPFSYLVIHYFPEYGRDYHPWEDTVVWTGVATQKNGLGVLCLFSAFFLIWSFIRRWQSRAAQNTRYQTRIDAIILIVIIYLMGGPQHSFSYSVTSNVSLILGLSLLFGFHWMKKKGTVIGQKLAMIIVALIIVYGTLTPFIGKLIVADISSTFGRDATLTGRNKIWADLRPLATRRPMLGYGFGGFWTTEAIHNTRIGSAHNGYLDIVLNLGFIGHFLFSIFLLACCRKAQKEMIDNFDWGVCFFCYLLMAIVHNFAESSIVGLSGSLFVVVLIFAVSSFISPSKSQMVVNFKRDF
jgi:exopolysaccharide production protein ExoQ